MVFLHTSKSLNACTYLLPPERAMPQNFPRGSQRLTARYTEPPCSHFSCCLLHLVVFDRKHACTLEKTGDAFGVQTEVLAKPTDVIVSTDFYSQQEKKRGVGVREMRCRRFRVEEGRPGFL